MSSETQRLLRIAPIADAAIMLPTVNRSAYLVRPRQPFIDWVVNGFTRSAGHPPEAAMLASLTNHTSIYLVNEDPTGMAEAPPLRGSFRAIFEEELAAWDGSPSSWPKPRTLAMFEQWLDVTAESIVFDLGTDEIAVDED